MTRPKILVVDDEPQIRRVLKPTLTASGYEVVEAGTGHEALEALREEAPELVLLDLGLPDLDGKEVLRRLRIVSETPVIVLSARDREEEKVMALDLGADDYVEKPFAAGELLARLRAALRHAPETPRLSAGDISIDVARRKVTKSGQEVKLTRKEFDLLALLARRAGRPLTNREILRQIWGPAHEHDAQYLRVLVGQLRAKIEDDPAAPRRILNEPGVGYRLAEEA